VFARLAEGLLHGCVWTIRYIGEVVFFTFRVSGFVFVTSFLELNENSAILKNTQWANGSLPYLGVQTYLVLNPNHTPSAGHPGR
jgi:hypothetical protein